MEQDKAKKNNKKIVIVISVTIIFVLISLLFYNIFYRNKVSYYENKMAEYGLAQKYNNGLANDKDKVTKSETVKIIVESLLRGENISNFVDVYTKDKYSNFIWVYYATINNLIELNYITDENEMNDIHYIDALLILNKIINYKWVSTENIQIKEVEPKIKYNDQYTEAEINIINKFISYGLIDGNYVYKKDKIITKKELNQLIVNFIEIFDLM